MATPLDIGNALEALARANSQVAYLKTRSHRKHPGRLYRHKALYFALCGDAVKVGVSSTPKVRMKELQTGAPAPLVLLAVIPQSGHKESLCHTRLAHLRLQGEWFRYTEEVDALIKELS